jgi:hypothetical protein
MQYNANASRHDGASPAEDAMPFLGMHGAMHTAKCHIYEMEKMLLRLSMANKMEV